MKQKLIIFLKTTIILGVLLAPGFGLHVAYAQNRYVIPGEPRRGWQVFAGKGCIQCHSMGGQGGTTAPDLFKTPSSNLSAAGLAAEMWNHAPGMLAKLSARPVEFKRLNETEMADLFGFLYIMRYMDEPGDPAKGKEVLKAKGCTECHSIGEKKGKIGPDLAMWTEFTNPLLWVQMMWNHASKMKNLMDKEAIGWPKLEKNDIPDIIAYVRSIKSLKEEVFLSPGDPLEGKKVFSQKGCGQCHATEGSGTTKGPELGIRKKDFPPTIGQFAGLMWNHFPEMSSEMQRENIRFPELSAKDIANITAYLFSIRYFDPAGDRAAGRKLFQEKQCNLCHNILKEKQGKKEGPNLVKLKGTVSPISMATALWNHGSKMIGSMKEKNMKWQKITDKELINLMEYLNQGN